MEWIEFITGDLWEEYALYIRPERGPWRATWWLIRQALWSLAPLLMMRRGDFVASILAAQIFAGVPILALDALWAFVYSQIPLKDSDMRPLAVLLFNLACLGAASFAGGRIRGSNNGVAFALVAAVTFPLHVAATPWWYLVLLPILCAGSARHGARA